MLNSHLRALAKEEGAVVLEENQTGVSVAAVRRQAVSEEMVPCRAGTLLRVVGKNGSQLGGVQE